MGFKFKRITFLGRSGEWGSGSSATSRAETVVRDSVQSILNMNVGWELDTDYNLSITNFYNVPYKNSSEYMPGLFLKNTISGNKLFICYIAASNVNGIDLPNSQLMTLGDITDPSYTGFIMSIIPGESGQSFGHTFDENFLPSSATRVYGTCEANGKTNISAYARYNGNNITYCWGVLATPYCVGISCSSSSDGSDPVLKLCYFCGRIFDNLSHIENTPQAKYGVIQFTNPQGGNGTEAGYIKSIRLDYGDASEDTLGTESFKVSYSYTQGTKYTTSTGQIFKANGSPIGFTSTANIRLYPENYGQLSLNTKASDSNVRWVPYIMSVVSTNLSSDGIIPGDGVKGFLDTSLFRCARVPRGTYLSNHSFISYGYNLLVGWDSSNTEVL